MDFFFPAVTHYLSTIHILNPLQICLWNETSDKVKFDFKKWDAELCVRGAVVPSLLDIYACIMHHQTSVPYILYNIYMYKKPLHQARSPIFLNLFLTTTFSISYHVYPPSSHFISFLFCYITKT